MAYSVPYQWSRGDDVTAARMNLYSDSIVHIYDASAWTGGSIACPAYNADDIHTLLNVWPFLHYNGSGELIDPDDATHTIALGDPETGETGVYDLRTVGWMYSGKTYRVTGCDWAAEDWEP